MYVLTCYYELPVLCMIPYPVMYMYCICICCFVITLDFSFSTFDSNQNIFIKSTFKKVKKLRVI